MPIMLDSGNTQYIKDTIDALSQIPLQHLVDVVLFILISYIDQMARQVLTLVLKEFVKFYNKSTSKKHRP